MIYFISTMRLDGRVAELVASRAASDSQARANTPVATRQKCLLRAFYIEKTAIQAVFSCKLPTSHRSVGIQMI
jgi:hypothetical protein